ncbi:MAG: T9SS type A sorting domain-containing protein [Bacteroidetes bacterium]|nr:T9SS type A sorting domain-containing protein [Bacteroidota bacterium]
MKTFTQQTSVSLPKAGMYIIRISDKNGIFSQTILVE